MRYFVETLGILLAGAGLFMFGWLLLGRLLAPIGTKGPIWAVLPASGDGEALEHDLRGLAWLRQSGMVCLRVVIADCGLSAEGRELASLLSRREEDVARVGADIIRPAFICPAPYYAGG